MFTGSCSVSPPQLSRNTFPNIRLGDYFTNAGGQAAFEAICAEESIALADAALYRAKALGEIRASGSWQWIRQPKS